MTGELPSDPVEFGQIPDLHVLDGHYDITRTDTGFRRRQLFIHSNNEDPGGSGDAQRFPQAGHAGIMAIECGHFQTQPGTGRNSRGAGLLHLPLDGSDRQDVTVVIPENFAVDGLARFGGRNQELQLAPGIHHGPTEPHDQIS
jgi:hypothetical protein